MNDRAASLGFDIGGQSVKAVLVSPDGVVLSHASVQTGDETRPETLVDALASLRDFLASDGASIADRVGVGIAGALDRGGTLRGSPHLPLLVGCRIADLVSRRLDVPVVAYNDADCAAMGEGWGGAADGCEDFLMVAIGTGVGSGLVLGGTLRVGTSGFGCEFGHMMVVHQGRLCGCGNRGCVESYVSETAARNRVEEASIALRERVADRRRSKGGGFAEAIFELGAAGDAEAEEIADDMVDVLGAAIGSVVNVLDLTTVVLGGGIAPGVLSRVERLRVGAGGNLFARPAANLDIRPATRGSLAGAVGAARLGMLAR